MADHWACRACAAYIAGGTQPVMCPNCGSPDLEEAEDLTLP